MKSRSKKHIFFAIIGLLIALLISGWAFSSYRNAQKEATSSKVQVVASTNVWGDITSQVGGDNVEVTSILNDPAADPHLFESDAKTASQVAGAQLIIVNGLGYDEFMDKLLNVSPDANRAVLKISDVLKTKSDANPHIWYDLPRIQQVAVAIQDQLIAIDPAHSADYQQNTQVFISSLQPITQKLTSINGAIAYTERVPEYLTQSLGLENLTPAGFSESVENGTEPSPQQVAEFEKLLRSGKVRILLYNNQATNEVTEQIKKAAQDAGVAVIGVSETIPKGKNFQSWQLAQLNAILEAL